MEVANKKLTKETEQIAVYVVPKYVKLPLKNYNGRMRDALVSLIKRGFVLTQNNNIDHLLVTALHIK